MGNILYDTFSTKHMYFSFFCYFPCVIIQTDLFKQESVCISTQSGIFEPLLTKHPKRPHTRSRSTVTLSENTSCLYIHLINMARTLHKNISCRTSKYHFIDYVLLGHTLLPCSFLWSKPYPYPTQLSHSYNLFNKIYCVWLGFSF